MLRRDETDGGSDNVVPMHERRGAPGFVKAPGKDPVALTEAYWDRVRRQRLVPSRAEIDPRGLDGALSNAFIVERISGGLGRFRIAGGHLADLIGLEVRGLPVSAIFEPAARVEIADALAAAFDDPAVIRLSLSADGGFGRSELQGEMILLPLRSDLGDITRLLGSVEMRGRIGRPPRRLRITGQSRRGLVGYAGDPPATLAGLDRPGGRALGPLAAPTRPDSARRPAAAHLRLVVVNDSRA